MEYFVDQWKSIIANCLNELALQKELKDVSFSSQDIIAEKPPRPKLGDIGFPMFSYAKQFRMSPDRIAAEIASLCNMTIDIEKLILPGTIKATGSYLNIYLDKEYVTNYVLENAEKEGWGSSPLFNGQG